MWGISLILCISFYAFKNIVVRRSQTLHQTATKQKKKNISFQQLQMLSLSELDFLPLNLGPEFLTTLLSLCCFQSYISYYIQALIIVLSGGIDLTYFVQYYQKLNHSYFHTGHWSYMGKSLIFESNTSSWILLLFSNFFQVFL